MLRFRVFGYETEISVWFCISVCVLLLADREGSFRWCMLAATLHEMGHLFAMYVLSVPKCKIRLTVTGIRLNRASNDSTGWKQDFLISIAGPLVNVTVFSFLFGIAMFRHEWESVRVPAEMQLALGAFNLLPVYPLDGGQAIASLLNGIFSTEKAAWISNGITVLFLLPLLILGILVLFRSRYNWTLLLFASYLSAFFLLKERF